MNDKMKQLTEMDAYMDKDIREVYINNVVNKLKRGIYPAGSLQRIKKLIEQHQTIMKAKENLRG